LGEGDAGAPLPMRLKEGKQGLGGGTKKEFAATLERTAGRENEEKEYVKKSLKRGGFAWGTELEQDV